MKKLLILAVLLVVLTPVFSIDFIPASGEEVPLETRNEQIYFHNYIHEYNWEGADTWAVRFNIEDFYDTSAEVAFKPDGVDFFYSSLDQFPISLSLRKSYFNQPSDSILVATTFNADDVAYGWNHWSFELDSLGVEFWVVMEFTTNSIDKFIPGSYGTGEHSYYENDGNFVNLNRPSEFLVNLTGDLVMEELLADAWVEDFYLPENGEDNFFLFPVIKLKATSDETVDFNDIWVSYQRLSPFRSFSADSIWVGTIENDETIEIDLSDPEFTQIGLPTEADNSEYTMVVNINSSLDGFSFNNNASIILDELPRAAGKLLVENSVKLDHGLSNLMWDLEETALADYNVEVLNYFSDLGDSLYSHDSTLRSLFYNFSLFPACAANGDRKINGILTEQIFQDSLQSYLDGAAERTVQLLTTFDLEASYTNNNSIYTHITLANDQSNYFSKRLTKSKLYVAVVEENISTLPQQYGSTMLNMVQEFDGLEFASLNTIYSEPIVKSFLIDLNEIDSFGAELNNLKIFAWLQNTVTKEIHHFTSLNFSDIGNSSGGNEDVPENSLSLNIYPNPFSGSDDLQVKLNGLSRNIVKSELKVYNVKGQLIRRIEGSQDRSDQLSWDGNDSSNNKVASGVYLLKIAVDDGSSIQTRNKKCLIINK